MAGETQVKAGNGVDSPVIPLQPIEIIDEDESGSQPAAAATQPADGERAGQYEYEPEDGEPEAPAKDARLANFQRDQAAGPDGAQPGETPEQLTARQRRRAREKQARDRERAEAARLREENEQLKRAVLHVDARVSNVERAGIDGQISALEVEIQRAQHVMARAMTAQNGDDFNQALEIRDQFRDQLQKLKADKAKISKQATDQGQEPPTQQQVRLPNGQTQQQVSFQQVFMSRHPWFNAAPGVQDKDSKAILQIDTEMLAEGKDPSTPAYWIELERRVQEDVPHRFQQAAQDDQGANPQRQNGRGNGANGRPTGGPKLPGGGSGGGPGAGNGGAVKFHLSKARKDAMIASGAWDDPVQKERQIRYFMKWDAENPSN